MSFKDLQVDSAPQDFKNNEYVVSGQESKQLGKHIANEELMCILESSDHNEVRERLIDLAPFKPSLTLIKACIPNLNKSLLLAVAAGLCQFPEYYSVCIQILEEIAIPPTVHIDKAALRSMELIADNLPWHAAQALPLEKLIEHNTLDSWTIVRKIYNFSNISPYYIMSRLAVGECDGPDFAIIFKGLFKRIGWSNFDEDLKAALRAKIDNLLFLARLNTYDFLISYAYTDPTVLQLVDYQFIKESDVGNQFEEVNWIINSARDRGIWVPFVNGIVGEE